MTKEEISAHSLRIQLLFRYFSFRIGWIYGWRTQKLRRANCIYKLVKYGPRGDQIEVSLIRQIEHKSVSFFYLCIWVNCLNAILTFQFWKYNSTRSMGEDLSWSALRRSADPSLGVGMTETNTVPVRRHRCSDSEHLNVCFGICEYKCSLKKKSGEMLIMKKLHMDLNYFVPK